MMKETQVSWDMTMCPLVVTDFQNSLLPPSTRSMQSLLTLHWPSRLWQKASPVNYLPTDITSCSRKLESA